MLLLHVKGATCFEDLMVDGSHIKACVERGLVFDDSHLIYGLYSSVESKYPALSRHLFALMLIWCSPKDPKTLWEIFKEYLAEDYIHRAINARYFLILLKSIFRYGTEPMAQQLEPEEKESIKNAAIKAAYQKIASKVDELATEGRTWEDYWVKKFDMDACENLEYENILDAINIDMGRFYSFF